MPRMLVVADDLTGAVDVAAAFQQSRPDALCVVSVWSENCEHNWSSINDSLSPDVFCINTDSRNSTELEARLRVKRALAWSSKGNFRLMKKVDSLLRGNVRAEVDEFLGGESSLSKPALFAPALPNQKRTTKDAIQNENGKPITRSQASSDPLSPATESDLRNLLPANRLAVLIPLSQVRSQELPTIAKSFSSLNAVFIPDVENNEDLEKLFYGALQVDEMSLIGSSGLLSSKVHSGPTYNFDQSADVLIVSASLRSEVRSQIESFISANPQTEMLNLEVESMSRNDDFENLAINSFKNDKNVVIVVSPNNLVSTDSSKRKETAHAIVHELAKTVFHIVSKSERPMNLVILGGDLSQEFCTVSSISTLTVIGSACQGGAVCRITDGLNKKDLTLILRSGGFGDHSSLLELSQSNSSTKEIESEK
jgi:uncharacterized protein YgbK (DUF1537 family)